MVKRSAALRRKMQVASHPQVKAAERAAMEKSADEVVQMMRRLVPVDRGVLLDTIGWRWTTGKESGSIEVDTSQAGGSRERITIVAGTRDKKLGAKDAYYARFVEFGTRKKEARPFFWPSWRANRQRIRGNITRAMNKAFKAAAK